MIKILHIILILLVLSSVAAAQELAELQTEMAEDLLLFFEEELVSATGTRQTVRRAPAIASVITAKDIEKMGARHLDEVMETVAGLHVGVSTLKPMDSVNVYANFNEYFIVGIYYII